MIKGSQFAVMILADNADVIQARYDVAPAYYDRNYIPLLALLWNQKNIADTQVNDWDNKVHHNFFRGEIATTTGELLINKTI